MKTARTTHAAFIIEKTLKASPDRVFAAFATREGKAGWFEGLAGWERQGAREFDFRIGGREYVAERQKGGPVHVFEARYLDIVPAQRIVYSYTMMLDEVRISASLTTIEITPTRLESGDEGTTLVFTEQGAFLDGYDDVASREGGTRWLLEQMAASVEGELQAAA